MAQQARSHLNKGDTVKLTKKAVQAICEGDALEQMQDRRTLLSAHQSARRIISGSQLYS
jgi:hypothetical protein